MKRLIAYMILALVLYSGRGQAQLVGDSLDEARIHRGIRLVYNLSFDSARAEFQAVARARPDHPAGHFFLAMVEWWQIITNFADKSRDERFLSLLDKVIDLSEARLDKDEDDLAGLFFKGGALGFQGRLYGNREEWLKAANCGRAALPIVQQASRIAPSNYDILLGTGIYKYYAAVIPDQFPFVKPFMIFFPKGDKIKGIEQLRTASQKAMYANFESAYFLTQILQNFEKQYPEALNLALGLHNAFPRNPIFHKYVGRGYAATGAWEEMKKCYNEVLDRVRRGHRGYDSLAEREAYYYLGLCEMNYSNHDTALAYFYKADELSRTLDIGELSGFMVMTNLKIGMIYDLQGKRELAIQQYQKVLDMKDFADAHKTAEQYLKSPYKKS